MNNLDIYEKILEINERVRLDKLYKKDKIHSYIVILLIASCAISIFISIYFLISLLFPITFIIFSILLYLTINRIDNKLYKRFEKKYKYFIKINDFYKAIRGLTFIEEIKKENLKFDIKEISELIDKEMESKKHNLLQNPFFTTMIAIGGAILTVILAKITKLELFYIIAIYGFIFFMGMFVLNFLRVKNYRKDDLKLFLSWYESFEKNNKY